MHYLDNAATTAVHPDVIQHISFVMKHHFANPSSLYRPGYEAEDIIEKSRQKVASAFGLQTPITQNSARVLFTASGSESNNLAILGAARARKKWASQLVATGYEHPSVLKALQLLAEQEGFELTLVLPRPDGSVDPEQICNAVGPKTALVCAMHVNNETGAVIDVAKLAAAVKLKNSRTAFHVDGVQAFTKFTLNLPATEIDSYAVSGHKIHAPKGVGALYLRRNFNLLAVLGGSQEWGLRPGTQNTPYIAGFAKAVELAMETQADTLESIQALHTRLLNGLAKWPEVTLNSPAGAWPGIVNISVPGIKSETLLHHLEGYEVYVSSGSACSKGEASHTLTAMGLSRQQVDGALRISFNSGNTPEDVDAFLSALEQGMKSLVRGRPGQK